MITGSDPSDHDSGTCPHDFCQQWADDSHNPLFPYFVAKHQACRNNSDKYLAFFLESA